MPFTRGFINAIELIDHFHKHKHEFGTTTKEEYELLADTFCGGPRETGILECVRSRDGDTLRYNPTTDEFGVLTSGQVIRTYFKLTDPRRLRGRTGLDYFRSECQKT